MRTAFAWTLRVTISPTYSLPVFLKVPMVAMSYLLLACPSPRPSRPRWRSSGPGRSADAAPVARSASGGRQGRSFLPREEWRPPGEESPDLPLRPRRSRRQPIRVRSAAERPARDAWRHAMEVGMTGYLWTAQDPGSMRRAKTGYGVQAETVHVLDVLRYSGIAPSRRVCVCLPCCSVCRCSKCMRDRGHAPQRGVRRSGFP